MLLLSVIMMIGFVIPLSATDYVLDENVDFHRESAYSVARNVIGSILGEHYEASLTDERRDVRGFSNALNESVISIVFHFEDGSTSEPFAFSFLSPEATSDTIGSDLTRVISSIQMDWWEPWSVNAGSPPVGVNITVPMMGFVYSGWVPRVAMNRVSSTMYELRFRGSINRVSMLG